MYNKYAFTRFSIDFEALGPRKMDSTRYFGLENIFQKFLKVGFIGQLEMDRVLGALFSKCHAVRRVVGVLVLFFPSNCAGSLKIHFRGFGGNDIFSTTSRLVP